MSLGANVRSVDAVKGFKVDLINFAEEAKIALDSASMEVRQVRNWLQRDQLTYWQSQVKRCQERVANARTELHRRQLSQSNSDSVSDTDQREALRDAQAQAPRGGRDGGADQAVDSGPRPCDLGVP